GLEGVAPLPSTIPLFSTVTGERLQTETMDAEHWYRNLRQTVLFAPAVEQLLAAGHRTFLEIGPHPVLTVPIETTAELALRGEAEVAALATLRRDEGGPARFERALAELWVRGGAVDWTTQLPEGGRRVRLPGTAFQRKRYWLDGVTAAVPAVAAGAEPEPEDESAADGFAARLAGLSDAERGRAVRDTVLGQVAIVLGHASGADVDAHMTFKEMGFDSPAIVELRNRINTLTGLRLAATVVFDHPTPAAFAERVLAELTGAGAGADVAGPAMRSDESIAIVGMACRYPGGADSPEALWDLVAGGVDAIGSFPDDRGWDLARLVDPDGQALGTTYVDRGGFLYDAGDFDPGLFGISPREALAMDPQQRLLLECSWEALERTGIDPLGLRGSRTGVFAGIMRQDYGPPLHAPDERSAGYALTGTESSVASGRISYVLGLEGPSVSVDTACSSSLVALHLAAQALRAGECDLALAGGATVMPQPGIFVEFSRQRGLSPDGRCRAFGASADGTGWGEGAGVIALERLSDAVANGHHVLAVVRGSAVNQDGASNGLTAPSGRSQERVIRAALAGAGLSPSDIDAVEAHGTGTTLGDPIEATALLSAYGRDRESAPLRLGSLKSNIGHTQAAAGVGGIIKMVEALQHEVLPPTLWADEPSPHVDWEQGGVELLTEPLPWPAADRTRRAAVSSFGVSGTNAHVILEEAPVPDEEQERTPAGPLPFLVSGASEAALAAQAERLAAHVAAHPELAPASVAAGLAHGRADLAHRAVAVASDLGELGTQLRALAHGEQAEGLVQGVARPGLRTAFVFPGQGGQWEGMAVELLDASPVFAAHLRACQEALAPHVDWVLEDVLRGAPGAPTLERVDVVQPALFAVMVALARLWEAHGIAPAAVIGHSQGEIAAAHIAGALSLEDAALAVTGRSGVLAGTLSGRGGMVAVGASSEAVTRYLEPFAGRVSLAAVNSPSSVVVSGEPDALEELIARCEADDVRAKLLPVDYAAHSAQIETTREALLERFAPITSTGQGVPIYSTVTGARIDPAELGAVYWYENLRQTVRYDTAVRALADDGIDAIIEIGPHPVLTSQTLETIEAAGHDSDAITVTGTLHRDDGGLGRFAGALAEAHVAGLPVDWAPLLGDARPAAGLPTYAFRHERFWLAPARTADDPTALGQAPAAHPLLDAAIARADGDGTLYTGRLSLERYPWLADHAVLGVALLPAAAFLDLALHAAGQTDTPRIEDLALHAPLLLDGDGATALQVAVSAPDADGRRALAIHSRAEGAETWTQHAAATLTATSDRLASAPAPPADAQRLTGTDRYDLLADAGYEYGPVFQGLASVVRAGDALFAEAALPEGQDPEGFAMHPALLDAVLQATVLREIDAGRGGELPVPFSFLGVELHAPHAAQARASLFAREGQTEIVIADETGLPVLTIDAFGLRPLDRRVLRGGMSGGSEVLHEVVWETLGGGADPGVGREMGAVRPWIDPAAQVAALEAEIGEGAPAPDVVFVAAPVADVHETSAQSLALAQAWLASEALAATRLVVLTRGAVAVTRDEQPDLAQAALVGLLRSAHTEQPDRFSVLDLDGSDVPQAALDAALAAEESVLAVRDGALHAPRLARAATAGPSTCDRGWHLAVTTPGTLEGLDFVPGDAEDRPLAPHEVRVAVRAAGLNFKDVVIALGLVPETTIGLEGAGVVLETGTDVTDLAPGDRVMGLIPDAFGPTAVADRRVIAPVPDGWSDVEAASVPVVFLTAYYALVDLAGLQAGERLLLHGAAGGVGQAALQLAAHLGAEVFTTAHPSKWETLTALGIDDGHRASSRTTEFRETFLAATDGRGVDVVLDSLAGEMVDASLDLLPRGGRFVEMGKTDIRDADAVAATHPGVHYQAFDLLLDASPERIGEMLSELLDLFARGILRPLPTTTRDVRDGIDAMRFLREARHTGKLVLRIPRALDPDGTVLITGGTGGLGAMLAAHLAEHEGARHLLLASRRGPDAPGASALVASLGDRGCEATVVACDVSDHAQVQALLAQVPAAHPLTAVIHTAGLLDDGTIASMQPEQLERVFGPKVDAALHLDALTADLAEFVLYSSAAATLGLPGQGNYAAANAVLDALAQGRRAAGLPGVSLAFGVWETATGMTGHVTGEDADRRAPAGLAPLPDDEGLAAIDEARARGEALLLPVLFDRPGLRAQARAGVLSPVLRGLFGGPARTAAAAAGSSFAQTLAAAPEAERETLAVDLVREHLAAVLGHGSAAQLDAQRTFKEHGIDSLSGVELRNRIARATGLTLPATLVFDHPTPVAVAALLVDRATERGAPAPAETRAAPRVADEPIAIVGIGCRFPGGADTPEGLWSLVAEGRDAIGGFPTDRGWDLDRLFDDDPDHAGTSYTRRGGFLQDAGNFDAEHFSISPREALAMDPQQRLMLECAWEALEDAGIDPLSLRGSRTGVFAGVFDSGYSRLGHGQPEVEGQRVVGNATSVITGRISFTLGLEGPAVSVDTACSSSLVATHLGTQALRRGECDLVLAGGVTVLATPEFFVEFSRQRALSADGRCRAFAADAGGTGFAEGAGIIVLERLSDAVRNGHDVLAVVRGSATNQDGASNGLSAPNGPSQERVIRDALADAGLAPADVDAVEAHGTGTALGDPIEAQALLATYGAERANGVPLQLGSLKSNIGHTQAAAGVAGIIKMVEALRHEQLPRTLHAEQPSPHVDWGTGQVALLTEPVAWPAGERVRRAAVSSFGISGTNAHVLLEEAPATAPAPALEDAPSVLPFVVSASSDAGLTAQAARLHEHLAAHPETDLPAVARTLAFGRAHLPHRAVVQAAGLGELEDRLHGLAGGTLPPGVVRGVARGVRRPVFVFPGQGGQWEGMAVALLDESPVFAERMRACEAALAPHVD
ncbi:MAG: SDR family NAD(P)-dependent oxidoreductase, partial [Solirubrobacteraceae bacterium]